MRCHVLITLLHQEARRRLINRGGLVFVLALVVLSAGMTFVSTGTGFALASQVKICFVDYWHDGPWVEHLRGNLPQELEGQIQFRAIEQVAAAGETIYYPAGAGAIQIRAAGDGISGDGPELWICDRGRGMAAACDSGRCKVWIWYPGTNESGMDRFEAWFWKESARYFRQRNGQPPAMDGPDSIPDLEVERSSLAGSADTHTTTTTALLLFPLFLTCVFLLPTWMCEDRERGLLLALALTPATFLELLAARSLFSALLGMGLGALVAAICCPAALGQVLFWVVLAVAALGAVGVGATIGSVASRPRTASLAALCYMAVVAAVMAVTHGMGLSLLSALTLESHLPRLLQAAISGTTGEPLADHLAAALALALAWFFLATILFRKRGWQ
jgi:hypothetical protein